MSLNIHHLELFYYVARHGGIAEAVRNMPYGIQQPAVSAQILQLEDHLGVSLFQRRPFCLMPAGDKLYRFIQPFFQNLENIAEEIRGGAVDQVRIGASDVILRDHLPEIMQRIRHQFPSTRLILRSGYQPDLVQWMQKQELDLALTLLDKNIPASFQSLPIIRLPLVLMVNRKHKLRSLEDLWKQKRITEPLLCLPPNEMICRNFQEGLRSRGVEWKVTVELSSLELIEAYVENEYGFGVGLELPGRKFSRRVRVFQLDQFPEANFGVIWQGKPTPFLNAVIQEAQRRAHLFGKTPEAENKKEAAKRVILASGAMPTAAPL
ncbi:MAG TPA: LysR family transcriptional regulator [Candidatus Kapabacteria bacterium]|nr:LysR family transcriptional regulator [Candidatus Kapabacteria bacterium]